MDQQKGRQSSNFLITVERKVTTAEMASIARQKKTISLKKWEYDDDDDDVNIQDDDDDDSHVRTQLLLNTAQNYTVGNINATVQRIFGSQAKVKILSYTEKAQIRGLFSDVEIPAELLLIPKRNKEKNSQISLQFQQQQQYSTHSSRMLKDDSPEKLRLSQKIRDIVSDVTLEAEQRQLKLKDFVTSLQRSVELGRREMEKLKQLIGSSSAQFEKEDEDADDDQEIQISAINNKSSSSNSTTATTTKRIRKKYDFRSRGGGGGGRVLQSKQNNNHLRLLKNNKRNSSKRRAANLPVDSSSMPRRKQNKRPADFYRKLSSEGRR